MQIFIRIYQNVLKCKRKRYHQRVCEDFRRDFLVTKAFKSLKIIHGERYIGKQIINYQTENLHEYETRDISSREFSHKINYNLSPCMFNTQSKESSILTSQKEFINVGKYH